MIDTQTLLILYGFGWCVWMFWLGAVETTDETRTTVFICSPVWPLFTATMLLIALGGLCRWLFYKARKVKK